MGKEALGYWFTRYGLVQGDFCLYVTRLSVKEGLQDEKGFGVDTQQKVPPCRLVVVRIGYVRGPQIRKIM